MTKLIGEIGLNHLGSEERAWRTLESLLETSLDAVTFQIREPEFYQPDDPIRQRLSEEFYRTAIKTVHKKNLLFGIAICDESAIAQFNSLGIDFWKTLSWDFKNLSLVQALQTTRKTIYMSTGLSGIEEIIEVSSVLKNIVLIHTQLSQQIENVNLKAIKTIHSQTNLPVAFGLHCSYHDVLKLAIGFEPEAIFFYAKEEGLKGLIDDEHAIAITQVKEVIENLRTLMLALGSGDKLAKEAPKWVIHTKKG